MEIYRNVFLSYLSENCFMTRDLTAVWWGRNQKSVPAKRNHIKAAPRVRRDIVELKNRNPVNSQ